MTFHHTKACLSKAVISVVENYRDLDNEEVDIIKFRAFLGTNRNLLDEADGYLNDGLSTCYCIVAVAKRTLQYIDEENIYRAQSYATAELQCGTITTRDYLDLVKVSEGRLPAACIHPGVFFPTNTPDALDGSTQCPSCNLMIWNGDL